MFFVSECAKMEDSPAKSGDNRSVFLHPEAGERSVHMKFQDIPYKRVDLEAAKTGFLTLTERMKQAQSAAQAWEVHQAYYQLFKDVFDSMTIAGIRNDIDTTDAFYEKEQAYYDEIEPELVNLTVAYKKAVFASPYRSELEEKIGKVAFQSMELQFQATDEKLIPLMQEENALTTAYDKLIAGAKIDWEGETLNLSLMRPYLTHNDRAIRRKAWKKYSAFFESIADQLDDIYDKLVKNRTAQARMLGYENYVQLGYYRMNRHSYGKKEVEAFRRQIKEFYVPFAEKIHDLRRQRLGLDQLSYIDNEMYFPAGNPDPKGTPEEILAAGQKMYEELSPETKEFFDFMMENQMFDVLGRKTKKQGGYMTYLYQYGSPFVFANFNGTAGDVDVITHECGHAFQGYLSGQDPILEHSDITMETAEIHSMSMEFFTEPWMELFFGENTEQYLSMHLWDAAIFIPYGCMVDEFQHIIYENPDFTPTQRHEVWRKLEQEYKPHLNYEDDAFFGKGGFWQKQQHIYNSPFYYIDYVLAQICAFQYKIWMDRDYRGAWESYLKLCRISAGKFYGDMLESVGLKVPFSEGCVKEIVDALEKKIK